MLTAIDVEAEVAVIVANGAVVSQCAGKAFALYAGQSLVVIDDIQQHGPMHSIVIVIGCDLDTGNWGITLFVPHKSIGSEASVSRRDLDQGHGPVTPTLSSDILASIERSPASWPPRMIRVTGYIERISSAIETHLSLRDIWTMVAVTCQEFWGFIEIVDPMPATTGEHLYFQIYFEPLRIVKGNMPTLQWLKSLEVSEVSNAQIV